MKRWRPFLLDNQLDFVDGTAQKCYTKVCDNTFSHLYKFSQQRCSLFFKVSQALRQTYVTARQLFTKYLGGET